MLEPQILRLEPKPLGCLNPLHSVPAALIFDGSVNPAHPKHIGSIDPNCDVVEVVKGNE